VKLGKNNTSDKEHSNTRSEFPSAKEELEWLLPENARLKALFFN
jgi:hypothetical protein